MNNNITTEQFGNISNVSINKYTLSNINGLSVSIINMGGIITAINTPDKHGVFDNIVLCYDTLQQYLEDDNSMMGAIVGPYANRIANARFTINKQNFDLDKNYLSEHHIHGGSGGLHTKIWQAKTYDKQNCRGLILSYTSTDGDAGYPGNTNFKVDYCLDDNNKLSISYYITTNKHTIINITNHSYFNLDGQQSNSILEHGLSINADKITTIDEYQIPTNETLEVSNTAFDFRKSKKISTAINSQSTQLTNGHGYDHNWIFNQHEFSAPVAILKSKQSGRKINLYSDQPTMQFYSGNCLAATTKFNNRCGLCLETQNYPHGVNYANFPSNILKPHELYSSTTIFEFGIGASE